MDCIERIHVQELEDFNSWRSIRSILSIEEYHGGGMVHVLVLESLFVCLSLSSSYCSVCRVWRSESGGGTSHICYILYMDCIERMTVQDLADCATH